MDGMELSYEETHTCPRCSAKLYVEVLDEEKKIYLLCEQEGCEYEGTIEYECARFCFTYREEFCTEVVAKDIEEARRKIEGANWTATGCGLWEDYLEVEYSPVHKGAEG
ncbi:MAG: hypothetical protein ACYTBJ_22620 [Planctomycetota bacterium]|jgi:hypothetical protein